MRKHVAVAHRRLRTAAARQVDVLDRRAAIRHDAFELDRRAVRVRVEPAGKRDEIGDRVFALDLVDRRAPNLAVDRYCAPTGGTKMASPACSRTSPRVSPRNSKS